MPQKRRLLLVHPRSDRGLAGGISSSGKAGFVRLALPTVAALTPAHWEVIIHDARRSPPPFAERFDLVGITAFTAEAPSAYAIADAFRTAGTPVVMGGVHASAMPEEALQHCDAVVIGEAEAVWQNLLADLEAGALKQRYRAANLVKFENWPQPRRDLLEARAYYDFNTLQATRGCPFDCDYCAVTQFFGRGIRCRPVAEVIAEIKTFRSRRCFFVDDNLIGNPSYAKEMFRALTPLDMRWGAQVSLTLARDEELLALYAAAGGRYAFIGFESLSPENLAAVNKSWNSPDAYAEAIRRLHRAGIVIVGSFIFGLDDDDVHVFDRTTAFIMRHRLDAAQFHILTPFPGTRLFAKMEAEGRIVERDWSRYTTNEVVFQPRHMSAEVLRAGYRRAWEKTYRLSNIIRRCNAAGLRQMPINLAVNLSYRRKAYKAQCDCGPHII